MEDTYDQASPKSIEHYGQRLLGGTLRTIPGVKAIPKELLNTPVGSKQRGLFGGILEKYYYGINPGNSPEPDFPEAKVELKSSAMKKLGNGLFSAKERLVLNLINYTTEGGQQFSSSSFLNKNSKIMLVSHLHEELRPVVDHPIKVAKLVEFSNFSAEDRIIIEQDWNKIVTKIRTGKAHELSEGDTLYLGACTKSATGESRRKQTGTTQLAKPRAFSFKQGFMTALIRKELGLTSPDTQPAITETTKLKTRSFEEILLDKFEPYLGKTVREIHKQVGLGLNKKSKNYYADIARRIVGVKSQRIEEFEKAEVVMKTIQTSSNGMPKEHMSFPSFKYTGLIKEDWDSEKEENEATWKKNLEKKFFFVIFQCAKDCKSKEDRILKEVKFWTMPYSDLQIEVKKVWQETVNRIKAGRADSLPSSKESRIAHVRPHAKNSRDTDITPQGRYLVKKGFWLNREYVKRAIESK